MGKRQDPWTIIPPGSNRLAYGSLRLSFQMITVGISSNCEHQIEARGGREHAVVPGADTFGPRRQVGARLIIARETEAHRHDGDKAFVIELVVIDPHPGTQALARWVRIRDAAPVYPQARRLAGDAEPRRSTHAQNRPNPMRQFGCTQMAGTDVRDQGGEIFSTGHA